MKNLKHLIVALLSIMFVLSLFACETTGNQDSTSSGDTQSQQSSVDVGSTEKEVDSIYIGTLPAVLYYNLNEQPAWNGIKVYARYEDGTSEMIPYTECEFSDVDTSSYGEKVVNVTYEGKSTEFTVYVCESLSFKTNTQEETGYLYENRGSGIGSYGDRFADENNYFTYKFTAGEGKKFTSANVEMIIRNEYVVAVSHDNSSWTVIAEGATGTARVDFATVTVNVTDLVDFGNNEGSLYFKFYDGVVTDGFGVSITDFTMYHQIEDYDGGNETVLTKTTITFNTATADESEYLFESVGSGTNTEGTTKRWADENSYFVYKFELGKEIKSVSLALVIENQSKIEVSFDGENWATVADSVAENANDCGKYFGNVTNYFSVEVTENTGTMYLKFSDADTSDGFGCCLYSFSMTAEYLGEPTAEEIKTTITFNTATADESEYLFESVGSGTNTEGTTKRWADENSYFVYKFELGKEIKSVSLALVIENQSKIEVSFDGENWATVADSVAENANDCGKYFGNVTNYFDVTVTENVGVMYLKFSDADTSDGFGCCLYSFSMNIAY